MRDLQHRLDDILDAVAKLGTKIGDLSVELRRDVLDLEHRIDDIKRDAEG